MKPFIRKFLPEFRPGRGDSYDFELNDLDAISGIPNRSGVYVIVSTKSPYFIYPTGKSPVIYIGESINLKQRIKEHYSIFKEVCNPETADKWWYSSRYQFMKYFGAHVYLFYCYKNQSPKELESFFLHSFYNKFHSIPFGNGARSFSQK